ncbi:hypothetical protein PC129_g16518 [Phytophthora cactorum]|uniref:Tetratricopeptide repeat n=1 Tax=Phytophthora cactorum TaxID=29920 RepID=A0A8T1B7A2_9STRA|nr:hypothetical protein Pcac1_g20590 [Phytophthora cactorum]KAG2806199.1 hypothetical protein PC112_g17941 [Phytophthora cactorum]KAG2811916.1 hypothetical protein PC111_g15029 [Phytophthora cactorum]KAG2885831.1 hypothetical protein PC114_g19535 [Phytophthora cactorum]KAG2896853.1 hypothetical protein PC115_g17391 [Phytophthora cactorum]
MDALLELELPDAEIEEEGAFEALVAVNHRWLGRYARLHPSFSVEPALLERNSLWMNAYFQKIRMTTSAASPQAKSLIKKHRETVMERLRSAPLPHSESPFSTCVVDPMAALMFASSIDRCPHDNLENLLAEAWELLQCASIRVHALQSGFAGCIFRFLTLFTETQKRIPCLHLLVLLAEEDNSAVVKACKIASQGQFWQPNMFVFSLQKRHQDNSTLCELAARLLACFSDEMPIPPSVVLNQSYDAVETNTCRVPTTYLSPLRAPDNGTALPLLANGHRSQSPYRPHFLPTTMSKVYQETPSPYSPNMKLPLTRPLTSPVEQTRRAQIFSMPKLAAVEGQRQYRCNTPNAPPSRVERSIDMDPSRTLDPVFASSPQSPSGTCSSPNKPRVVVSEKYSWNPECINSVSGFEWWWRSLPQNHASLEPTQKLKMVTKAAVRLHSKGDLQRAIELYLLALSSETNDQVKFRLRINLACAYEAAENLSASIEEFRLALELNPNDPYAIYKLGSVLTSVGEFEEARMRFESILDEYSQAADGLQTLDNAVETHRQEEEATRAAIAAAKTRRSPSKVLSPRIHLTTLREPIAPLTPVDQSPTPRRKINAAAKQESPALRAKTSEKNEPTVSLQSPPKPETTTVATLTDTHLASPNLLGLLVRRCREARINILEVLQQLDPQQRGLIHRKSFMSLIRIIAGVVDFNNESQKDLGISPDDWVTQESQDFLHYGRFINAYTEQHQVEAQHLVSGEVGRVKRSIDDLIRNDLANISSHNVSGWMRSGSERAAVEVHRNSPLSATFELNSYDGEAAAGDTTGKQSGLGSGTDGTRSAPDLHANGEDLFTPRTRARKDRAREEWLLTAEKARVLARRQQRCMKSLRDIAARATAHIISRRNAVAFLLVVAQNAQEEVKTRKLRCVLAKQEEIEEAHTNHHDEAARLTESTELVPGSNDTRDGIHLNTVKGLSEETFHAYVRSALTRVCQNAELEDFKTIASRFAAFCQVPSFFLEAQVPVPDESGPPELQ